MRRARRYTSGMRKLGGIGVLAAALLLAGCSAGTTEATPQTAAGEPSAAAIAEQPPASAPPSESTTGEMDPDEFFLKGMANSWHGDLPSDDELLGAAKLACQTLQGGTAIGEVVVVEGDSEDAVWNNGQLVNVAAQVYCPEYR